MNNLRQLLLTVSVAFAFFVMLAQLPCQALPKQAPTLAPEGSSLIMLATAAAPLGALLLHRRKRATAKG